MSAPRPPAAARSRVALAARSRVALAVLLALVCAAPAAAAEVARTTRFVFSAPDGAEGIARALAKSAESLRDEVAVDLGRDYPGVTEVRVGHTLGAFRSQQPPGYEVPSWAAGVAFPELNLVVLNAASGRRLGRLEQVLTHELSHLALGRLAPGRFPRWFMEGFATWQAGEWDLSQAAILGAAVSRGELVPLEELTRRWPERPTDVQVAYAQSIHLVGWIFREFGREAVHRLVAEVVAGRPFTEALELATGTPLWRIERTWQEDVRVRYNIVPVVTSAGFLWGLMSLLFVWAYAVHRRRRGRRLARLEAEEQAIYAGGESLDAESLDAEGLDAESLDDEGLEGLDDDTAR